MCADVTNTVTIHELMQKCTEVGCSSVGCLLLVHEKQESWSRLGFNFESACVLPRAHVGKNPDTPLFLFESQVRVGGGGEGVTKIK